MPESCSPQDHSNCDECQSPRHKITAEGRAWGHWNNIAPQTPKRAEFSSIGCGTNLKSVNAELAKHTKAHPRSRTIPRLKSRISFARSKSLQQLIVEDKEKLIRARNAQDARDLKVQRDAENKAKNDQKKADKEKAKQYNKEKKRRQAEEKRNSMKWGGIVRGFDPNAGLLRSAVSEDNLHHSEAGLGSGQQEDDSLNRILNPKLDKGQTWGVEYGAPGRKGRFDISGLSTGGGSGVGSFDGGSD